MLSQIRSSKWVFAFLLLWGSGSVSATSLKGHYKLVGLTCQSAAGLTSEGKRLHDQFKKGEKESLFHISNGKFVLKERHFLNEGQSDDHCIITATLAVTFHDKSFATEPKTNNIILNGGMNKQQCLDRIVREGSLRWNFQSNGDYLYLSPIKQEATSKLCQKGNVFFAYKKIKRFQLSKIQRTKPNTVGSQATEASLIASDQ